MALILPKGSEYSLTELNWDSDTLRALVANTLESHNISSGVLLKAWDQTGDGALNRTEFLQRLQSTFFSGPTLKSLWTVEVRGVAEAAFETIAGMADSAMYAENQASNRIAGQTHDMFEQHIDVIELEGWLTKANLNTTNWKPTLKTDKELRRSETARAAVLAELQKSNLRQPGTSKDAKEEKKRVTVIAMPVSQSMPQLGRHPTGQRTAQRAVERRAVERRALVQRATASRAVDSSPSLPAIPRLPVTYDRSEWNPPPEMYPAALPSATPLRPRRSRIKPVLNPIRPLDLPFEPKLPSDEPSVTPLGHSGDEEVARAEKQYAHLCVLKESEQVQAASCSYEMRLEMRRLLRDKSVELCRTYNVLGTACTQERPEMAHALLQRARTCAATANDASLKITTLANIGLCWLRRGNPSTAATTLRQAERIDTENPQALQADERTKLRLNLCAALCQLGSHTDALRQAEELVASTEDPVQRALALHNVCVCHEFLRQPAKALAAAERALELARANLPEDDQLLRRLEEVARSLPRKTRSRAFPSRVKIGGP